jgi:hypothetical protein
LLRQVRQLGPHCIVESFFAQLPPQSCVPAGQTHWPALHIDPPEHVRLQPPQCWASLVVSTQSLPHCVKPALHPKLHEPDRHDASACAPAAEQLLSHEPQRFASDSRSAQLFPHNVGAVAGQPETQVPFEHIGVSAAQAFPHPPQFSGCVTSVSQPVSGSLPQCAQPLAQAAALNEQAPAEHVVVPTTCGKREQSWLHAPQFLLSLVTHAPAHDSWPAEQPLSAPPLSPPLPAGPAIWPLEPEPAVLPPMLIATDVPALPLLAREPEVAGTPPVPLAGRVAVLGLPPWPALLAAVDVAGCSELPVSPASSSLATGPGAIGVQHSSATAQTPASTPEKLRFIDIGSAVAAPDMSFVLHTCSDVLRPDGYVCIVTIAVVPTPFVSSHDMTFEPDTCR